MKAARGREDKAAEVDEAEGDVVDWEELSSKRRNSFVSWRVECRRFGTRSSLESSLLFSAGALFLASSINSTTRSYGMQRKQRRSNLNHAALVLVSLLTS